MLMARRHFVTQRPVGRVTGDGGGKVGNSQNTKGQGSLRPDFHKVGSVKEKHDVSPWSTKFRGRFFVGHGLECTIHIISPFVYYI